MRARPSSPRRGARSRPAAAGGKVSRPGKPAAGKREDGPVMLAAECTAAEAESLKAQLARRLQDCATVALDVSAMQRIDTAGLQLLAAFVRDRRTAGRAVEWRGKAAALAAAAGLLGLNEMLELAGEVGR